MEQSQTTPAAVVPSDDSPPAGLETSPVDTVEIDPAVLEEIAAEGPPQPEPAAPEPTPETPVSEPPPDPWGSISAEDGPEPIQKALEWARKKYSDPVQAVRAAYEQEQELGRRGNEIGELKGQITAFEQRLNQFQQTQVQSPRQTTAGVDENEVNTLANQWSQLTGMDREVAVAQARQHLQEREQDKAWRQQVEFNMQLAQLTARDPTFHRGNPEVVAIGNEFPNLPLEAAFEVYQARKALSKPSAQPSEPMPTPDPSLTHEAQIRSVVPPQSRPAATPPPPPMMSGPEVDGKPVEPVLLQFIAQNEAFVEQQYGSAENYVRRMRPRLYEEMRRQGGATR